MERPSDIPQDVWGVARLAVAPEYAKFPPTHRDILSGEHDDWPIVRVAARAIMKVQNSSDLLDCAQNAAVVLERYLNGIGLDHDHEGEKALYALKDAISKANTHG